MTSSGRNSGEKTLSRHEHPTSPLAFDENVALLTRFAAIHVALVRRGAAEGVDRVRASQMGALKV